MSFVALTRDVHDRVATLSLQRPEKRNPLSLATMRDLTACLHDVGNDPDVAVVILTGIGKVFSSGHDLAEMIGRSAEDYRRIFDVCCVLMEAVQHIPQPVIAMVRGVATAAGCQLVATCDLAIADEAAHFATPGVKIGLFCSTPMVALTRVIGRKRAMHMLLTGDPIDARTAAEWGLVNEVVPSDQLEARTRALAQRIASASPRVVGIGKEAFYAQIERDQHAAYDYAKSVMSLNALMDDAQEGMCAFLEKRSPVWKLGTAT
jgi:enoyl-CoA hydratase/carnithine racemase